MTIFYKGVGIGTHWHGNDPRISGFQPFVLGGPDNVNEIMSHIGGMTGMSPYVSLSKSFGIAEEYAMNASATKPTSHQPAYVFQIDFQNLPRKDARVVDPVKEVARHLGDPLDFQTYHHDGDQDFLLGVVDPSNHKTMLQRHAKFPRGMGAIPRPPHLSRELQTLARALRDAEVLVIGGIPSKCVVKRHEIF